jgi:predicted metalloprotease with PDZ domain
MKIIFALFLAPLFSFAQSTLNYEIFYSPALENEGLKVCLSYQAAKAGDSTCLHFSNAVWGEADLHRSLRFLSSDNPGYSFRIVSDSDRIVVRHPKTKTIRVCYRLVQDHRDSIIMLCRPKIKDQYFHILGHSLFILPETVVDPTDRELNVNIKWTGFPDEFKIHNTFGTQIKQQSLKVKLWTELYMSLFAGGDYRIYSFKHIDKPVYFAVRGKWFSDAYSDEHLLEAFRKAVSSQRDFWKDSKIDYYTMILTPSITQTDTLFKGQSMKGSAVKNGFIIQSTNNVNNNSNLLRYILNHEMMHDWIGGKIKMKHEELNYWFSEGFTDYYAFKNRLRSGDLDVKGWATTFNKQVLSAHWKNPEKNQPNHILRHDFWKSRDTEKLPYRRGAIFAFWLDNQIMKQSNYAHSLDDVMRELLGICVTEKKTFTDELFLDVVQNYVTGDIPYLLQKYMICGEDLQLKNEDLIDAFKVNHNAEGIPQLTVEEDIVKNYYSVK